MKVCARQLRPCATRFTYLLCKRQAAKIACFRHLLYPNLKFSRNFFGSQPWVEQTSEVWSTHGCDCFMVITFRTYNARFGGAPKGPRAAKACGVNPNLNRHQRTYLNFFCFAKAFSHNESFHVKMFALLMQLQYTIWYRMTITIRETTLHYSSKYPAISTREVWLNQIVDLVMAQHEYCIGKNASFKASRV